MSKYLNFVEVFRDMIVMNKKQKEPLGRITFYTPWKQYVLEPAPVPNMVFNNMCLVDIIKEINRLNHEYRENPK